jgi:high-affinity iron transporter
MFPSFLLSLREGLEAALIIGIVLGALQKINRTQLIKSVWLGTGSAFLLSLFAALGLNAVGASIEGAAEAIFEGFAMLVAAGVLTWMIFWMQRQSRNIKSELEVEVQVAAARRGGRALFTLAFVAVLREGIELALFLTATAAVSGSQQVLIGGLLGLVAAVALGWALFATTIQLNLQRFFLVSGILLILFAAGLLAHGVHEFNELGWIPPIIEHVWDLNPILAEDSVIGMLLKALFGYNGNPSLTEVIAYVMYFVVIGLGLRRSNTRSQTILGEA